MTPDYLKAIAELLSSVAWPVVGAIIVLTQRHSLTHLLENLELISGPGGFKAELRKVNQLVDREAQGILNADKRAKTLREAEEALSEKG